MTDGDALLAAILANPDEDTPRLAYADWLDENGQAERASRVRVATVERGQLNTRTKAGRSWSHYAAELVGDAVPKSWVVWLIEYPFNGDGSNSWEHQCGVCSFNSSRPHLIIGLRHGFVEAVAAPTRRLVKTLPALVRRQPVIRVAVTTTKNWTARSSHRGDKANNQKLRKLRYWNGGQLKWVSIWIVAKMSANRRMNRLS